MNQPDNFAENPVNEEAADALNQEYIEQVWTTRAAQMALVEKEESGEQLVVVLLRLGRDLFGLDVHSVRDIRPKEMITRVPRVPGWVAGVTNLRGRILSVIDLRAFLGLPASTETEKGVLVLVQSPVMEIIFLVDDVPGVEVLPVRQDLAGDTLIHHLRGEYVQAVVERSGSTPAQQHITVLSVEALLADPRLIIHEELS
jgi:purine-binding chemotaxis protein CheW